MAIDVGSACIDGGGWGANYTTINKVNPANASGTIDYICIYCVGATGSIEVASFADEGSNVLSTNGTTPLANGSAGVNEYNAPGDFTAFNINSGEYIGIYYSTSNVTYNAGIGLWYVAGDSIPASSVTFTWLADYDLSLYATGTESAPPVGAIMNQFQGANLGADLFNGTLL